MRMDFKDYRALRRNRSAKIEHNDVNKQGNGKEKKHALRSHVGPKRVPVDLWLYNFVQLNIGISLIVTVLRRLPHNGVGHLIAKGAVRCREGYRYASKSIR